MKSIAITMTSGMAMIVAFAGNVSAGGLGAALTETPVVTPTTADLCAPSRSIDLRGGAMRTDNVWANEARELGTEDKVGLGDAEGGFAGVDYAWDRCDSDLTIGAGFAGTDMSESGSDDFGNTLEIDDEASFAYLDIAYGRPLNESIRYSAGLRVLDYASESRYAEGGFVALDSTFESSFVGIGPIVGVSYETPNRSQGQFGFLAKASAAALFGSQENEKQGSLFAVIEQEQSDEMVVSLDVEASVFYNMTDNSAISLGILYQRLNDIDFVSDDVTGPAGRTFETGDREFTGAFVGYSYQF
jgi:hypothetical protein